MDPIKRKYMVSSCITISVYTEVEATSKSKAIDIAMERGVQSLCHQCASGDGSHEQWCVSGLDGEIILDEITADRA